MLIWKSFIQQCEFNAFFLNCEFSCLEIKSYWTIVIDLVTTKNGIINLQLEDSECRVELVALNAVGAVCGHSMCLEHITTSNCYFDRVIVGHRNRSLLNDSWINERCCAATVDQSY
jgi:hypothetical protein